ncbi:MAG TPA: ABC transporter substrate-binding protein [Methylomirabilota bacterium]|jgi:branched-chain amino acid transport system substrate-binding protein|nr:ABC transporter substrate-binding protein [Methylomirabilota bacterium]
MLTRTHSRLSRRVLVIGAAAGAIVASLPRVSRAEPRPVRIGALHPVTGPFADIGLACRLGAQLAVDLINAAGGIVSLDGAPLELLVGDTSAGAAAEAERLYNARARVLTGAFHSGHTAAAAGVARRRGLPFLIDTAIADATVLPVLSGERVVIFRNFPTTTMFARRALQSLTEMSAEAQRPITRVTLMHTTDPLGTTQARRLEAAYTALRPSFELLEFVPISPRATSVSAEVTKVRAAAPDVLLLAVRPSVVGPLFTHLARAPLATAAVLSVGTPDLADAARVAGVGAAVERVMELAAWPNLRNPSTQRLVEEFVKRSGGRRLDATAGYAHEAVLVVADALERAASADAVPLAEALRRTSFANPLMVAAGPIAFDANGENVNAVPAVLQIFGGRPVPVWPQSAAERPFALSPAPRP